MLIYIMVRAHMDHPLSHRLTLGEHFNEGARLLWSALDSKKWSQAELRRRTNVQPGVVSRWLYGERRPSLGVAIKIRDLLGIPVEAWNAKPTRKFTVPAARTARRTGTDG